MNSLVNAYALVIFALFIAAALYSLWRGGNGIRLVLILAFTLLALRIRSMGLTGGVISFGNTPLVVQPGYTWVAYRGYPYKVLNQYVPRWLAMGAKVIQ